MRFFPARHDGRPPSRCARECRSGDAAAGDRNIWRSVNFLSILRARNTGFGGFRAARNWIRRRPTRRWMWMSRAREVCRSRAAFGCTCGLFLAGLYPAPADRLGGLPSQGAARSSESFVRSVATFLGEEAEKFSPELWYRKIDRGSSPAKSIKPTKLAPLPKKSALTECWTTRADRRSIDVPGC